MAQGADNPEADGPARTMKVLTNLDCVTPPLTGIGHYTQQLATRLARHPQVHDFRGMYRNRWLDGAQMAEWPATLDTVPTSATGWKPALRQHLRQVPGGYSLRHRLRSLRFACQTRSLDDFVYWEPGLELGPFPGRRVATVYDLSHLVTPESHPPARVAYLNHQVDRTLRQADRVVAISRTMRRDIAQHAGLREADIAVVPPAADPHFRPLPAEAQAAVRARLGLPERYILSVGTLEPRKNLLRLIRAYEGLPAGLRRHWPLVCVGGKGWNDASLVKVLKRLEARGELVRLGYVAQQDLPLITAAAGLLAYPSIYEGFGMPVVEALACAVPVLTSRGTSMHEITEEDAFLVDPHDEGDMRETLGNALENPATRARFAARGPARAAHYDWDASTERLLAALRGESGAS